ncbi:heavy metal translocating P-type ATPase [Uliginosibacterium sp. H1]|uniref:heavy metal translocating P-type ATPase n=1 Tax=Uliginosibacterium sp. H1 TaxID=3114757 RepID=UPI002E178BDF|nr:heavy metal translocating P-type ATPase [Uliginosibacterium sp. H1]
MSAAGTCYHCGLPVPAGSTWQAMVEGSMRPMCCAGCQAVAETIVASGMSDYYRQRSALPESPADAALPDELSLYDRREFREGFVREPVPGECEADLVLEGITCAACVWLNERTLAGLPGMRAVHVNYATRRARVRWKDGDAAGEQRLSAILAAVARIGYRAWPYDPQDAEGIAKRERREALWRLFIAGFGMMQVMMYAYPAYIAGDGELSDTAAAIMRWASLILTLPVVLYSAAPFFRRAWRDVWMLRLGMDVPVALGIGAAFVASLWSTLSGSGEVYYDSVTMFVFFLLAGRYAEMLARQRAQRGAEALARAVPAFARRVDGQGEVHQVPVAVLAVGDEISVWPGETIVVDGVVVEGASEVDEAWLSGESRLLPRAVGDAVLCGSVNSASPLRIRATGVGDQTRLSTIRRLIERAAMERPRVVQQAERVAGVFVASVLLLAAAAFAWWWQHDAGRALWVAVSVLVVSCPCALSLATPAALTVAIEAMRRHGLLVTRAHAIETLGRAGHFAFDKTGTLSDGAMHLRGLSCAPGVMQADALAIAAALERDAGHAIAAAIIEAAPAARPAVEDLRAVAGQGVVARIAGRLHAIGRAGFVQAQTGLTEPAPWMPSGGSEVLLASEEGWIAAFDVGDAMRPDAPALVAQLRTEGGGMSVFSGDAVAPVNALAQRLGIADARAAMLPEDKQAAVRSLQNAGKVVAMIGDGVNDAPVLATADVSVAMAGGTALARQQADIVLLQDSLARLGEGRVLARRTLRVIRQNLGWAAAYNLLSIPAAMAGWVTPWMAGLGMGLSSLLVVLNALRLSR